jgi:hypothetical protein
VEAHREWELTNIYFLCYSVCECRKWLRFLAGQTECRHTSAARDAGDFRGN